MKRQEEAQAKRREEMQKNPNPMMEGAAEAGWGNAKPGLDWVKNRRGP
jgi:hypothetical protein